MKKLKWQTSYFDARWILCLYPLLLIIGKIVRWTVMQNTLIHNSAGWGYPPHILNDPWTWEFFGIEELSEGDIGLGGNIYTFFKIVRLIFCGLPDDFYTFEICLTVFLGTLMFLVLTGMKKKLSDMEAVFVSLAIIVNSVYCFNLGKEAFQMIFFLLIYMVLKSGSLTEKKKFWGTVLILTLSIMCFRTYYALILVFSFAFAMIVSFMKKMNEAFVFNLKNMIWIFFLMCLVYLAFMLILEEVHPELYERFWNALLHASDATSAGNTYIKNRITPILGEHVWGTWLEYMLAVVRLLFPLELIGKGPKYWPFVLYQLIITFFIQKALRHMRDNSSGQNLALILFVGFLFASAAFETDYGAWIRHSAVTFPVILMMAGIIKPNGEERPEERIEII